ncbi:MAG: FkbM family methyltransferase [Chloroflexota bacterium]
MIKIVSRFSGKNQLRIGEIAEFEIIRANEQVETRAYVTHQNVHYLKPLNNWNSSNTLLFFPESPGRYTLAIQWRHPQGAHGWIQQHFQVNADRQTTSTPQQIQIDQNTRIWAPGEWEALLLKDYEKPAANLLPRIVAPASVVYDIGANLGIYSLCFSRLVGPQGRVYCFEANPVCVYFLQANLELNQAKNCEILPVAITDQPGNVNFTLNYGNSALGLIQTSGFYASKTGHEIGVHGLTIDTLIETFDLASPNLIKIDIEGAEEYAVIGLQKTLERCHPTILLEVHGRQAAHPTFRRLHNLGYRFQEITSGQTFDNLEALLNWFPEAVMQFLCTPVD